MSTSSPLAFLSSSNLILQATLALTLSLLLSFLKIPVLFLHALHTYIHPDDVNPVSTSSHGVRAAIRRPGTSDSELKPRRKSKEKFEFDENKAQIFRLKLNDSQILTRVYCKEFSAAFNSTFVALLCLLLHKFLGGSEGSGILRNGSLIPTLLGFLGLFRVFILIARVSFERSASKRLEKQLSFVIGVVGFLLGLMIVFGVVPKWTLDFSFETLDGYGKFSVAVLMGCIVSFLYIPAARSARAFWLGTDQLRCSLSIISCGLVARMLLYAKYLLIVLTSMLWFNPFAELLVNKNTDGRKGSHLIGRERHATGLAGNVGTEERDFYAFRIWCLLLSGILQIVTLRPDVQMYLNEAVLCWYQRLHASKVPDLDYSRAKVFLHNHYLCLVVVQFFAPAAMILLFLGLSQIEDNLITHFQWVCNLVPCSALVEEVAIFMSWWVVFVLAILTSVILALYRRGILFVS